MTRVEAEVQKIHLWNQGWIEDAWDSRYSEDWNKFFEATQKVCLSQGWDDAKLLTIGSAKKLLDSIEPTERASEVAVLAAARLRFQGSYEESEAILSYVVNSRCWTAMTSPWRPFFELADLAIIRSDFSSALKILARGLKLAENPFCRVLLLCKKQFCLEELGLSCPEVESEVETHLSHLDLTQQRVKGILKLRETVRLRKAFYQGDMNSLQKSLNFSESGHFLLRYYQQLPYLPVFKSERSQCETYSSDPETRLVTGYYERTLSGQIDYNDLISDNSSEWVQRLYLWVWRWLTTFESADLEKVMFSFYSEPSFLALEKLGVIDRKMLRNSLSWLSLFDPVYQKHAMELVKSLCGTMSKDEGILDFEYGVICWLIAKQNGKETDLRLFLNWVRNHSVYKSKKSFLSALFDSFQSTPAPIPQTLELLGKNLSEGRGKRHIPLGAKYEVDIQLCRIRNMLTGRDLVSEPCAKALELLSKKTKVSVVDFIAVTYGVAGSDFAVLSRKTRALLSKLNTQLRPDLSFGLKSGCVVSIGNWGWVSIVENDPNWISPKDCIEWRRFLCRKNTHTAPLVGSLYELSKNGFSELSRFELQNIVRKSRATTHRMLVEWEKKGWVIRTGKSRNIRYLLSDEFKQLLKKGEVPFVLSLKSDCDNPGLR